MTLSYQLDQKDFLQHQLFAATKSERIKKKRINSWLIVTGTMLLLGFLFYESDNSIFGYYFLGFGIVTLIFYPLYQRSQYKNHYAKFISETYKNRFGQTSNVTFTDAAIEIIDNTGEMKINLSELEYVTETGDYFYASIKSGGHIIIPKSKIGDISPVRNILKQICESHKINFIEDLNWKWK